MKKYMTTNKIWKIVSCYLLALTVLDYLHINFGVFSSGLTVRPFISIMVLIDLIILVMFSFKTKIGLILTIFRFFILAFTRLPYILTINALIEITQIQGITLLYAYFEKSMIIIFGIMNLILIIFLLGSKSSRQEFKQAKWFCPSFLLK